MPEITTIHVERPERFVLFAAGRGGDPTRHLPLLRSLGGQGCAIVAPHFEMMASPVPTASELSDRVKRLEEAAVAHCPPDAKVVGIGHSIGTVALLVLAGGIAETSTGNCVRAARRLEFYRLALLAPPTDFFRRPGSLNAVSTPMRVWSGAEDRITPPFQAQHLKQAIGAQTKVDIQVDEDAGHFTYMDVPPPNVAEPHPDRDCFLAALANDIGMFASNRL